MKPFNDDEYRQSFNAAFGLIYGAVAGIVVWAAVLYALYTLYRSLP